MISLGLSHARAQSFLMFILIRSCKETRPYFTWNWGHRTCGVHYIRTHGIHDTTRRRGSTVRWRRCGLVCERREWTATSTAAATVDVGDTKLFIIFFFFPVRVWMLPRRRRPYALIIITLGTRDRISIIYIHTYTPGPYVARLQRCRPRNNR